MGDVIVLPVVRIESEGFMRQAARLMAAADRTMPDAAKARFKRRRANQAADRAFWKGGAPDLAMGSADPELEEAAVVFGHTDTAPCDYVAPDHDCA